MKTFIFTIFITIVTFSCFSQNLSDYLDKDTKLRYYLHNSGNDYEFIVEVKSLGDEIEFDWWMTRPASNEGSVKMTKNALDSAIFQQNSFHGGYDELTNTTTVWVSKKVYNALKNKESIEIYPEDNREILSYVSDYDYSVLVDGKEIIVKTLYAEGDMGDKFWILDDPQNPVILKMVVSFNIEIGEIMTKGYWEN